MNNKIISNSLIFFLTILLFSCKDINTSSGNINTSSGNISTSVNNCLEINDCFIKYFESEYNNSCGECSGLRYFTDVKSFVKDNNYYFITEVISHEPIHSSVFSLDCYCENYTDLGSTASWGKLTQNDINDIILSATELNQVDLVETVKSVISNKLRSWNSNLIDSLSQVNNQSSTEEILNEIELWEKKSQNYSYVSKVVEIVSTYLVVPILF
jgi:hypothetical protein